MLGIVRTPALRTINVKRSSRAIACLAGKLRPQNFHRIGGCHFARVALRAATATHESSKKCAAHDERYPTSSSPTLTASATISVPVALAQTGWLRIRRALPVAFGLPIA